MLYKSLNYILISWNMHIKSVLLHKISNYLKVNAEIILKLNYMKTVKEIII